MTNRTKLPAWKQGTSYAVGFGKPPRANRFKPGQSGNPRRRPRGAKNKRPALNEERLKDIILDEAYRDITVRDGDRNVAVPMAQAIVRSLAVNAAKGQHRAQRLFAEMLTVTERQNKQLGDEWLQTVMDYKIDWERELDRRARLGITDLPEPIPHPYHVRIDMNTGQAWVAGPFAKEEKAQLDEILTKRDAFAEELIELRKDLETEQDEGMRQTIRDHIGHIERLLDTIAKVCGGCGVGLS